MVDIFARLEKNAGGPIGQYMSYAHGYFAFPKLEGEIGPHMVFRGKKMLNWSLNNYLGLATIPKCARPTPKAPPIRNGRPDGRPHDERPDRLPRAAGA